MQPWAYYIVALCAVALTILFLKLSKRTRTPPLLPGPPNGQFEKLFELVIWTVNYCSNSVVISYDVEFAGSSVSAPG